MVLAQRARPPKDRDHLDPHPPKIILMVGEGVFSAMMEHAHPLVLHAQEDAVRGMAGASDLNGMRGTASNKRQLSCPVRADHYSFEIILNRSNSSAILTISSSSTMNDA